MEKLVIVTVTGRPISLSNSVKAFGHHGPIMMDTEDIFRCLISDAEVIEVDPNNPKEGIRLNLANYKMINFDTPVIKEDHKADIITPFPKATPDMLDPIVELPNATPEMDGGIKNLDNIKEIADYVAEHEEELNVEDRMIEEEVASVIEDTHVNVEPTTPAIDAVDETIPNNFIPKADNKPNYNQQNRNNNHHGKNKNRH